MKNRRTGVSRGCGFVHMEDDGEGTIAALDGQEFRGRLLAVHEVKPKMSLVSRTAMQDNPKALYGGNPSQQVTEADLEDLFSLGRAGGRVRIMTEVPTGKSRGCGFVDMTDGDKAVADLKGKEFNGRPLAVRDVKQTLFLVPPAGRNTGQ
jgi:RNA recognition motif-containing protein